MTFTIERRPKPESGRGDTYRVFDNNVCIGLLVHYRPDYAFGLMKKESWMACSGGIPEFPTWEEGAEHLKQIRAKQEVAPWLGQRKVFEVAPGWTCKIHITDVNFLEINRYGHYSFEAIFEKAGKVRGYVTFKGDLATREDPKFDDAVQKAIVEALGSSKTVHGLEDDIPHWPVNEPFKSPTDRFYTKEI